MDEEFQDIATEMTCPNSSNITFHSSTQEMLRVAPDGFYVRGVKVPTDENEAQTVYRAFKRWMVEAELRRPF